MQIIILAWFIVMYTAFSIYAFIYALTVKPAEVHTQGTIQKLLYYNAVFLTVILVFGAIASIAIMGITLLTMAAYAG